MAERVKVDSSFRCRIRATSTRVTARGGLDPPQPVPATPMPGRRVLRVMNCGVFGSPGDNIFVLIGDEGIRWTSVAPLDTWGFGLDKLEFVEIPVDDAVRVFALLDPTTEQTADVRTIELG